MPFLEKAAALGANMGLPVDSYPTRGMALSEQSALYAEPDREIDTVACHLQARRTQARLLRLFAIIAVGCVVMLAVSIARSGTRLLEPAAPFAFRA
jgi:hypothetical protein